VLATLLTLGLLAFLAFVLAAPCPEFGGALLGGLAALLSGRSRRSGGACGPADAARQAPPASTEATLEDHLRRDFARDAIDAAEFELRLSRLIEKKAEIEGGRFDPLWPARAGGAVEVHA